MGRGWIFQNNFFQHERGGEVVFLNKTSFESLVYLMRGVLDFSDPGAP
jgi:hypothetical protein